MQLISRTYIVTEYTHPYTLYTILILYILYVQGPHPVVSTPLGQGQRDPGRRAYIST